MPLLQRTIETLSQLIAFESVSSTSNAGVCDAIAERLESLGFQIERSEYLDEQQRRKVNLVARREPQSRPSVSRGGLAYFCHTDVVPAIGWTGPGGDPFTPIIEQDHLFGRGACDMKGSLAVMLTAASQLTAAEQTSPLWIVCTADEEVGFEGAKHLVRESDGYREIVAAQPLAIIGEPTRLSVVHAHKGIVGCRIISHGRAAHSSTTDGINANEAMVPLLQRLLELAGRSRTDPRYQDDRFGPPLLSWNFGVSDHSDAVNITPQRCVAWFSLRPMPEIDGEDLIAEARETAEGLGLEFQRFEGGRPFWIEPDAACIQAMCELAGGEPTTVCYGTDGGELTELQRRVVCGPGGIAQAHTTDEWIELEQLTKGIDIYSRAIREWCAE
jgi:acetylornithine deacetylase